MKGHFHKKLSTSSRVEFLIKNCVQIHNQTLALNLHAKPTVSVCLFAGFSMIKRNLEMKKEILIFLYFFTIFLKNL